MLMFFIIMVLFRNMVVLYELIEGLSVILISNCERMKGSDGVMVCVMCLLLLLSRMEYIVLLLSSVFIRWYILVSKFGSGMLCELSFSMVFL